MEVPIGKEQTQKNALCLLYPYCGANVRDSKELKDHLVLCDAPRDQKEVMEPMYMCPACGRKYLNRDSLKKHQEDCKSRDITSPMKFYKMLPLYVPSILPPHALMNYPNTLQYPEEITTDDGSGY